jgi:hypothetical protein
MSELTVVQLRPYRAACRWTGSNETDFESLVTLMGLDGSVSVDDDELTVSWSAGSWYTSGSAMVTIGNWLVEQGIGSPRLGMQTDEEYNNFFIQVYP